MVVCAVTRLSHVPHCEVIGLGCQMRDQPLFAEAATLYLACTGTRGAIVPPLNLED